jgi:hypothetical protein
VASIVIMEIVVTQCVLITLVSSIEVQSNIFLFLLNLFMTYECVLITLVLICQVCSHTIWFDYQDL